MTQEKIDRINELARKSRSCELSKEEKEEQKILRDEFRRDFVGNLTNHIECITLVDKDGKKTPVKDLRKDEK